MRPQWDDIDDGGDRFTDFMSQSAHRLYRVAYLLTGDRDQAEELTQSALVPTYTAWHRIRHEDGYGYARRILVNLHNDWWRGRLRWERPVAYPPDRSVGGDPATAEGVYRGNGRRVHQDYASRGTGLPGRGIRARGSRTQRRGGELPRLRGEVPLRP